MPLSQHGVDLKDYCFPLRACMKRKSEMPVEFLPCMFRAGVPGILILVALLAHWNEALNHKKDSLMMARSVPLHARPLLM